MVSAVVGYLTIKYFLRYLAIALAGGVRLVSARARGCGRRVADRGPRLTDVMWSWLRRRFITGFFVTVPLIISVAALVWIFRVVDGITEPLVAQLGGRAVPGLGLAMTALLVLLVGVAATNVIGKRVLQRAEYWLLHVPLFRTVYAPVKQLVAAFSPDNEYGFKRVVLVEEPGRGYVLGFLTREFTLDRERGRRGARGGVRADQSPVSRRRRGLPARAGAVSRPDASRRASASS